MTVTELYIATQQVRSERHILCRTGNTFAFVSDSEIERKDLEIIYAPDKPSILEKATRHANPKRKIYAKRITVSPQVPTSQIRRIVGNYHVSTPHETIEADMENRISRAAWDCSNLIKAQTKAVAIAIHQQNSDFFKINRF